MNNTNIISWRNSEITKVFNYENQYLNRDLTQKLPNVKLSTAQGHLLFYVQLQSRYMKQNKLLRRSKRDVV